MAHEDLEPKLGAAMKALHTPKVPASVDRTIREAVRTHFDALRARRVSRRRWLAVASAAAAAVLLVSWFVAPESLHAQQDVNQDGQVDVLDAFALARQIRDGQATTRLDQTGEGRVDQADVAALAQVAVRLPEHL